MTTPNEPGWWMRAVSGLGSMTVHEYVESVFEQADGLLYFSCASCVPRVQSVDDHAWIGRMVLEASTEDVDEGREHYPLGFALLATHRTERRVHRDATLALLAKLPGYEDAGDAVGVALVADRILARAQEYRDLVPIEIGS